LNLSLERTCLEGLLFLLPPRSFTSPASKISSVGSSYSFFLGLAME
jgi:hypothetical protein